MTWMVFLLTSLAVAQDPVDVRLGVADAIVAGGWNALSVVTRNMPDATLTLTTEPSGGPFDGVAHTLELPLGSGAGVQRRDVVVPMPRWRDVAWRVTQGDRIVASGTRAARGRDDRPLDLLLTAVPSAWLPIWPASRRALVVTLDDLPRLDAAWQVVDALLVDGSLPLPSDATLVTAAVMGADVHLPNSMPGSLPAGSVAARLPVDGTPVLMGAGSLRMLPVGTLDDARARRDAIETRLRGVSRREGVPDDPGQALADAIVPPGWDHRPRSLVLAMVIGYGILVSLLLRIPARDGLVATLVVTVAAATVAGFAGPSAARVDTRDGVVIAASGIGVRFEVRHVANLAGGALQADGLHTLRTMPPSIPASAPSSLHWWGDVTSVDVPRAGRVLLGAPPLVTSVPDAVHAAAIPLDDAIAGLPDALLSHARALGVLRVARHDEAWWLLRDAAGGSP